MSPWREEKALTLLLPVLRREIKESRVGRG
jgi:hypothetical protein